MTVIPAMMILMLNLTMSHNNYSDNDGNDTYPDTDVADSDSDNDSHAAYRASEEAAGGFEGDGSDGDGAEVPDSAAGRRLAQCQCPVIHVQGRCRGQSQ